MVAVFASLLLAIPTPAGAQSGGLEVALPPNTDCRGAVVITKATVVEDAAAANMLAEALRVLSPGGAQRCLLDAGLPPNRSRPLQQAVPPNSVHRSSARLASKVYVVGGPAAIPDSWLAEQFGVASFTRVAGTDRWRTQENVAAAIVALATGGTVPDYDSDASASAGFLPNGSCHGTAVLAKLTVVEERAAANMLAEALKAISGTPNSRCLIDVGDPGADVPPTAVAVKEAHQAAGVYLLGGEVAVPQAWLDNGFDIRFLERISGPDRWATQAEVAETIIDIARGSTLPHQFRVGDVVYSIVGESIEGQRLDRAYVALGDGTATPQEESPESVEIDIHYCRHADKLGTVNEQKQAAGYLAAEVGLLNHLVAPFFMRQSDGNASFRFKTGMLLHVGDKIALSESLLLLDSWFDNDPPYFPRLTSGEEVEVDWHGVFRSPDEQDTKVTASLACLIELGNELGTDSWNGFVLVDQEPNNDGGDYIVGWAAIDGQLGAISTRPINKNIQLMHVGYFELWTFAHEFGHAWLGLCHPHERDEGEVCLPRHDELVFSPHLEGDENRFNTERPYLCSLMSYCGEVGISDAWISCGQREILGWPDGPLTPYGECQDGRHVVWPLEREPEIAQVTAQWPSDRDNPLVTVSWDSSKLPSCATAVQVSFDKHPTRWNYDDAMHWVPITGQNQIKYERDKDATYDVTLKYRCDADGESYLESKLSAARKVTTPATPHGKPGRPGQPTVSSREERYLSVVWKAAKGVVVRHEVQWRPSKSASAWQKRIQRNDGASFDTDGLKPGTCYEIRVRAGNDADWGDWSPSVEACTTGSAQLPTPSNLALAADSDSIRVEWSIPLVYHPDVLDNVKGYTIEWGCETAHIAPLGGSESVPPSARSVTIDGLEPGSALPNGRSCKVRVAAVGPNGKAGKFTDWQSVTVKPPPPTGSVSISAGSVNAGRTSQGSCGSGNDCHDLRYTISGLGGGPYALECWFGGKRTWSGQWSGKSSTGCYFSSAFSGTIQVAVDGVKSNTISVTGTQPRSAPDAPGRPSVRDDDGSLLVSWSAPDDNGAAIDRHEVGWRRSGVSSWSKQALGAGSSGYTISGLAAGVSYEVRVRARNSEGWGDWSPTATAEAASVPGAPRGLSVTAGDGKVDVSWGPSRENGSPVTGYTVSWSRGGTQVGSRNAGASARSHTITGLTNGAAYSVSVVARSAVGDSAASSLAAFPKAAARVPDAPRSLSVTAGDGQIDVSWRASRENGAAVTGYLVAWSDGVTVGGTTLSASARSYTITGLRKGTRYDIEVVASSSAGSSPASAGRATPVAAAAAPDAPGRPSLRAGGGEISVSWTAPDDNGAAVDRFEVRWRRSGVSSWSKQAVAASSSNYTVSGLRDGTSYEVGVRARNSVGWGDWSPTATAATAEAGSVSISAGSVNAGRTSQGSCGSGNDCHDLRYTIRGLGGPYALECWFGGKRTWSGQWSGKPSTGCYYSSAFSGTVQVVVDGVKSNTITVVGAQPRSVPDAPGRPSLSAGGGEIAVSWSAPDDNGAAIDRFEVRWRRSGVSSWSKQAVAASSSSYTVSGLRDGASYEVGVRARNSVGWGDWSRSRSATTEAAASVPDAPPGLSVTAGDGKVDVSWGPSPENGSPVTGYAVSWSRGGTQVGSRNAGASARSHTITGLTNGAGYTVSVVARSAVGDSAASSLAAFPKAAARVPDAPRSLSVTAGDGQIEVSWRASRENGAAVTGYVVAWSDGVAVGGTTLSASARSYTITGLRSGVRYEVEVAAESSAGASQSATAHATTRAAVTVSEPDAPSRPSLRDDDGSVLVSWSAPDDNGATIDRYEVRYRRSGRSAWNDWEGNGSTRRLRITNTSAGTTYEVGVRARNSEGWGPWSRTATVTTQTRTVTTQAPATPSVSLSRGARGPTSGRLPCASWAVECRWLHVVLRDFEPGRYRVYCYHDGWSTYPAGSWKNLWVTIGSSGGSRLSEPCYINFPDLTGSGVKIIVTDATGTNRWQSNWLK